MEQFPSLREVLVRMKSLGAERIFCKVLQENDNSKQQIYVGDSPSSVTFAHPTWEFDAELAIPKAGITFHWVTPTEESLAPHAKLVFYSNYPEVRLSGLLQGSSLAPRDHMRPIPRNERRGNDSRVLILGIRADGAALGHLAIQGSNSANEAISLDSHRLITELTLNENGVVALADSAGEEDSTSRAFGIVVESPDDELDDDYSDDSLFDISSWGADLSFRELINRYDEDELVKPELQRHYVWDKIEASRFIDSILLGLPVPSIFLAKTKDEKLLIVDGYQRLMTVRDYVKGTFTKDGRPFRLSSTKKIHERWRGKLFLELTSDEQRKIRNTTIHAIVFMQQHAKTGDTSLYQIFERINSSGRTLLPQEIRNCVYQGPLNSSILKLNEHPSWRNLWGSERRDDRMRDVEFILRFFALSSDLIFDAALAPSRISLKKFLNDYMETFDARNLPELQHRFVATVDLVHAAIGASAFHNISPSRGASAFSPTIFDAVMIGTDRMLRHNPAPPPIDLRHRKEKLLSDPDYQGLLYQETMRTANIRDRVSKMQAALYE